MGLRRFPVAHPLAALVVSVLCAVSAAAQTLSALPGTSRPPAARDDAIPLSAPILVLQPDGMRELAPGTPEYYRTRVKNRYYLEDGRLEAGLTLRGRVVQIVDGTHVWLREQVLRQEGASGRLYAAWVDGRDYLVTVPSSGDVAVGQTVEWLIEAGAGATCEMADGTYMNAHSGRRVDGVTFEDYVAAAARMAHPVRAEAALVSFQMRLTAAESEALFRQDVARLRASPEGQRIAREVAAERRLPAARQPVPTPDCRQGPQVTGTITPVFAAPAPPGTPEVTPTRNVP